MLCCYFIQLLNNNKTLLVLIVWLFVVCNTRSGHRLCKVLSSVVQNCLEDRQVDSRPVWNVFHGIFTALFNIQIRHKGKCTKHKTSTQEAFLCACMLSNRDTV